MTGFTPWWLITVFWMWSGIKHKPICQNFVESLEPLQSQWVRFTAAVCESRATCMARSLSSCTSSRLCLWSVWLFDVWTGRCGQWCPGVCCIWKAPDKSLWELDYATVPPWILPKQPNLKTVMIPGPEVKLWEEPQGEAHKPQLTWWQKWLLRWSTGEVAGSREVYESGSWEVIHLHDAVEGTTLVLSHPA